jgi:hypothetical protein
MTKRIELVGGAADGRVMIVADDCIEIRVTTPVCLPPTYVLENPFDPLDLAVFTVLEYAPRTQADEMLGRWRVK